MEVQVIRDRVTKEELKKLAKQGYGDLVKVVVDVEQGIMAAGGEFHADEEVILTEQEGSRRENTWGINLYPDKSGDDFIEFDSMINLKPVFGNRSRGVENSATREKIKEVVNKLVQ